MSNFSIIGLIFLAAFSRLIPHPANFTAVGAIALFAGGLWGVNFKSLFIPIAALFISDLILGFHSTMFYVYLANIFAVLMAGKFLYKKKSPFGFALIAIFNSMIFFVISNFAVWLQGELYPKDFNGLVSCFTLAIPFYSNQLFGDIFYSVLIFSCYKIVATLQRKLSAT